MPSKPSHFTLRVMPHNAQNGRGSLPHFMQSMYGDAPKPHCHVYLWNPAKGDSGAWETILRRDDEKVYLGAIEKAEAKLGRPLLSGDMVPFTIEKSGNRYKVVAE